MQNGTPFSLELLGGEIEGFTVADVILVVGQTRQIYSKFMYGKNRDFDAR